jgi:hypothetical protein
MTSANQAKGDKIYVPLLGVRCDLPGFHVGPLQFVHVDETAAARMRTDALGFLGSNSSVGPVKDFAARIHGTIDELTGTTALLYECETDHVSARDKVFSAALDALAFLRLLASFVFSELLDPVIDFYGNFTYDFGSPYYFAILGGSGVFSGMLRLAERNVLVISDETVELSYALGLDNLLKLYQQGNAASEFEQLILRAVGWFSSASVPMRYENRLLNYVTSLEMFLGGGNAPVAQNVSEGAALFIADSAEARLQIAKVITDYYNERSRISHEGALSSSLEKVLALKSICKTFLAGALARHTLFSNKKQFREYIKRIRLSGARPF